MSEEQDQSPRTQYFCFIGKVNLNKFYKIK